MYGLWDHADGYGYQPDSSFYVNGNFHIELPAGAYTISLSKGIEYQDQHHNIEIEQGEALNKTYRMQRWVNIPARNWYSADDHIHIRRSTKSKA